MPLLFPFFFLSSWYFKIPPFILLFSFKRNFFRPFFRVSRLALHFWRVFSLGIQFWFDSTLLSALEKYCAPSFCLHDFWWKIHCPNCFSKFDVISLLLTVFKIFVLVFLFLVFRRLTMMCLCVDFFEIIPFWVYPASWVSMFVFYKIWEIFNCYLLKCFLALLSFSSAFRISMVWKLDLSL